MRKSITILAIALCTYSCIPLRVAPTITDYKISKGNKFKRSLPKRQMFIFTDTKEAEEFYNFVNIKYNLNHIDVYDNVPFQINGMQYFFSFYEVSIPDKAINLFPFFLEAGVNAALNVESEENPEPTEYRKDYFYIAIEVYNDIENDCLSENSLSRTSVLNYLRELKNEYLSTHNYNEVLFKN